MRVPALMLLSTAFLSASVAGQPRPDPKVAVCLVAYNADSQEARYRVTIQWDGLTGDGFERFDIGAEDDSGATWPQLRDQRLKPRSRMTTEYVTVSDVSRYPLQFMLIGFRNGAAKRFDSACRNSFCSVRLPAEDVVEFGQGSEVSSVAEARRC
jgi:hypothetical protein